MSRIPVVDDAVDHHPLRLDAIFVVLVIQLGVLGVLGPPLLALPRPVLVLAARPVIQAGRLVHVRLPLVVSVHHRVEDLKLEEGRGTETFKKKRILTVEGHFASVHPLLSDLQLSDPGAVPVGLPRQLDKELPLGPALHGWRRGGVGRGVGGGGDGDGQRRIAPSPVEDLLDSPFD